MRTTYCEQWSDELRSPSDELTEAAARERDARGEHYCVVLGDPATPSAIVDITWENGFVSVSFVDDEGRTHTSYIFRKMDDTRLFMTEVTTWHYPEGTRYEFEADVIESAEFRPDGYASRTVDDSSSDRITKSEYTDIPVDSNWEPIPAFGDWASVARYDRAHPPAE